MAVICAWILEPWQACVFLHRCSHRQVDQLLGFEQKKPPHVGGGKKVSACQNFFVTSTPKVRGSPMVPVMIGAMRSALAGKWIGDE
jgi:hypothetical protein